MSLAFLVAVIGWSAAGLILLAYALLTAGRLTAASASYQWLNLLGAAGFVVNSGWNGAMPSAVLNVVWSGFAIYGLVRIAASRRALPPRVPAPPEEPLAR